MAQSIAVLGGNGVYARHLIPRLIAAGHKVRAVVRRPDAAGIARDSGAEIRTGDIFDTDSMAAAFKGCDIAINLATSLPGPSGRGDFAANDRLRVEGAPNFVAACEQAGMSRVIQQSISFLNASGSADWSDEDHRYVPPAETIATKAMDAAEAMEATIRASDLDWIILRGGLFYGPGTGFDERWFAGAAAGKLKMPGDGADYVSLVHIADMAAATVATVETWPSRQTLIVCDDAPAQWREVFGFIATSLGQPAPATGGAAGFPSFRLRNTRAKAALGWQPFYKSFREGLAR
jgi:nucleoside-diphosphate-sugar epimerase